MDKENEKLIYVLKVGKNTKGENIYEFLFSEDITNISPFEWGWNDIPANEHSSPPTIDYITSIYSIKTKNINLFCLHEATDREYMQGYHTIHALAYEKDEDDMDEYERDYIEDYDDKPLLVFHYGMSFNTIKKMLDERNIKLKE